MWNFLFVTFVSLRIDLKVICEICTFVYSVKLCAFFNWIFLFQHRSLYKWGSKSWRRMPDCNIRPILQFKLMYNMSSWFLLSGQGYELHHYMSGWNILSRGKLPVLHLSTGNILEWVGFVVCFDLKILGLKFFQSSPLYLIGHVLLCVGLFNLAYVYTIFSSVMF